MRESKLGTMFKFDPSWRFALNDYDGEVVKAILNALCEWRETGEIPDSLTGEPRATLKFIIVNIERMDEWSGELSEARSRAGKIGGGNPNFKKGQPNPYYINKDKQDKQDKQTLSNINKDKQDKQDKQTLSNINKDKQDKLPILSKSYPNPNPNEDIEKSTTSSSNRNFDAESVRREKKELVSKIVAYYNSLIDKKGARLRKCERINKEREGHILARLKEYGEDGKQNVATVIKKAVASRGLNYDMKIAPVDIGWIMRPRNFTDILEGKYDDKDGTPTSTPTDYDPQSEQKELYAYLPEGASQDYKDFYLHLHACNTVLFEKAKDKLPTQVEFRSLVDEYGYELVEDVSCVFSSFTDEYPDLYSLLAKFCPEEKQMRERKYGK